MKTPHHVTMIEVGPRDGLQNESAFVPTPSKVAFINLLSQSGLQHIEVTSFVSAKAIPQLTDGLEVFRDIDKLAGIHYSALIPNEQGMLKALTAGVKNIALFTAASELFSQHNTQCSIAESIERMHPIISLAKTQDIHIRAYISCVLGCPYEGTIPAAKVLSVVNQLVQLGIDDISLGDTIGVGTPKQTKTLISSISTLVPLTKIAMHFHDTYGQAIANTYAALEEGITQFDSSVAGLGGCPYALGASGNVATEDMLYLLHGLGIETGIDIYKIVAAGDFICKVLGRKNQSKVANALLANHG